jgi:hypothetical protein
LQRCARCSERPILKIDASWLARTLVIFAAAQAAESRPAPPQAAGSAIARPTAQAKGFEVFVEKPDSDTTGPLHLIYSDGSEIVETLPPKPARNSDANEEQFGFSGAQIAGDGKTVGWTQPY